jgi:hypothetical protein
MINNNFIKIIEIGMNKFGLHMNFLGILQVLANIFILNPFPIYFSEFSNLWIGRQIQGSQGLLYKCS